MSRRLPPKPAGYKNDREKKIIKRMHDIAEIRRQMSSMATQLAVIEDEMLEELQQARRYGQA